MIIYFLSNYLKADGYGQYGYIYNNALLFVQITSLGLISTNQYFITEDKSLTSKIWSNSIIVCIISAIVSFLFFQLIQINENSNWLSGVAFALLCSFTLYNMMCKSVVMGLDQIKETNRYESFGKLLNLILIVLLISFSIIDFKKALVILIFSTIILSVLYSHNIYKRNFSKFKPNLNTLRENLGFSFQLHVVNLIAFLVYRIDIYFVKNYLEPKDMGVYSLVVGLAENMNIIGTVISGLMINKFAKLSTQSEMADKTLNIVKYNSMIMFATFIILLPFISIIFDLLFHKDYSIGVIPFIILLSASILLSLESIIAQFIYKIKLVPFLIKHWIISLALNIICNFLLIKSYGLIGVSISTLVAYGYVFFVILFKFLSIKKQYR
ncbi:MAG: oligosaccharide flippase family protein [Bacteroidetes bacterium]|nr:oligosaccharide flippase family protein [Bacteroidota bacterium]